MLALSLVFVAAVLVSSIDLRAALDRFVGSTTEANVQTKLWARQAVSLLAAVVLIVGLMSVWFSDPARLATAFGLMSAGLAFALQQLVTSGAGYFVILRGANFTVGDRISLGGVVESFDGRLRDECLNTHLYLSLADTRAKSRLGGGTTTRAVLTRRLAGRRQTNTMLRRF